jgi:hypothetical protein
VHAKHVAVEGASPIEVGYVEGYVMQGDRVGGVWLCLGCRHQNLRRSKRTLATDIVVADELAAELNMADLRP